MTGETARQILTQRFETEWAVLFPTYARFIDGVSEPDFSSQADPFVFFSVALPTTSQIGMDGNTPPTRSFGYVEIGVFARAGAGTKPLFEMSDAVVSIFGSQVVGGIRLTTVTPRNRPPGIGWQSRVLRVNYNFDSID